MNEMLRSSLLLVALAAGACDPRADQKHVLRGHTKAVLSLAFSQDGKTLASSSADGTAKLWDVTTSKERATFKGEEGGVACVAFSPDGKVAASQGSDVTVRLWDAATGRRCRSFTGHKGAIHTLAFSPDGKTLVVGGEGPPRRFSGPSPGDLRVWDVQTGRERLAPEGYTGIVGAVVFSLDGRTLAGGDAFCEVTIWEVATNKVRATLTGHHSLVGSLAFSADGKTLASGSHDNTVRLWNLGTGKTRSILKGHAHHVYGIALSRKGRLLVSGSEDKTIMFWDTSTGKELATIYEDAPVWSVALSPDGKLLAAGVGNTIKIWNVDEVLKQGRQRPPPPEKDKGHRPR